MIADCGSPGPLGMEDGSIADAQITGSSYRDGKQAHLGRLNNQGSNYWAPQFSAYPLTCWIQVDFLTNVELYGIQRQGFRDSFYNQYVSTLEIQTGDSEDSLTYIQDGANPKVKARIHSWI